MKLRYFSLMTLHCNLWPSGDSRFVTARCCFKSIAFLATVLSLTTILASCGEKPTQRVQIHTDLTTTLTKQMPLQRSTSPNAVSGASNFDKAILQAVEANDRFRAAISLEREMMANIGVAESARRLQVTGNSTVGGVREQGGKKPSDTTIGLAGSIQASQLIYDGGESVANINSATAKAVGARIERIIIGNELALEAARGWIDVWQYEEKLDLLNARSMEMEKVVSQIERMASNGMIDRAALDSVLRKVVAIKLEETRLQADLSQSKVRFSRFFNEHPSDLAMPTGLVTMSDARAQLDSWQEAPDLQRNVIEVIVAQNAVSAAKAAFKPKAKFQAGVMSPMQAGESSDASVGLLLEYKFSDGGRRRSQVNVAEAQVDSAAAKLLDAQRSFKAEMDAAAHKLKAIELSMPLLAQQIIITAAGAKTAKTQLTTGQANLNRVIETQIESYRAEDAQITMYAENLELQFLIASRTGLLGRLIGLSAELAE